MKIYEIISESAQQNRISLSESQINEIVEMFGNDLTEEQLDEIAGGDFLKKLVITAATAAAMLGTVVAHGEEVQPDLQQVAKQTVAIQQTAKADHDRYEQIAAKLNDQREVSHRYSVKLTTQGGAAETQVMKYDRADPYDWRSRAQTPHLACEITLNTRYLDNLSDDAVAWVLGHEMGHCELKHSGQGMDPNANWNKEYSADKIGAKLAQSAGYNPQAAYKEMTMLKQHKHEIDADYQSATHPDYQDRMDNLAGKPARQAQIMKPSGTPNATTASTNPDGSVSIRESRQKP